MGKVVAAGATMHAPQLFTRPPEEDLRQLDARVAAMGRLGKVLDETKPDALIVFASDHLDTFFLNSAPTFAVISGERVNCKFAGKSWDPPIHQALAEEILEGLVRRDFDMAYSQDAELGHSFAAVFEWVLQDGAIPVVPIFINTYLPPLPNPHRAAALGKAIAEIVARRPENVAVLASGGMSHYPGTWKYYKPAYDFDHWCIKELENGHSNSFLDLTVQQLDEVGNTEMLPWAPVLGAVGTQHMELFSYQETSHHGHAVARFHPGPKENSSAPTKFQFKEHAYEFYKHPAVSAYKLNKLLFDSRYKPIMRQRMLVDVSVVAAEYGLRSEEIAVLKEVCKLSHNNTDQPALDADPLVKLGAHPVGALMAIHVLQAEQRRMQRAAVLKAS